MVGVWWLMGLFVGTRGSHPILALGGEGLGCAYLVEAVDWTRFFRKFKPLFHFYPHNRNSAPNLSTGCEAEVGGPNLKSAC